MMKGIILLFAANFITITLLGQIIADHSIVDKYDDIPQFYIDEVKKMWLSYAGESHSGAIRAGLLALESVNPKFAVSVVESGNPQPNTTSNLRASRATWGDLNNTSSWIYTYGEEDWYTSSAAISRTKAGFDYCNNTGPFLSAFGFGWCWDPVGWTPTPTADPEYGVHWTGASKGGPDGSRSWGLDADDYTITSNRVSMDTYLYATQEYIDYCKSKGYKTKVFFTTGPVDGYTTGELRWEKQVKYDHIRAFVAKDPSRILFDYADILCYDDNGTPTTGSWNGHVYYSITSSNLNPIVEEYHISSAGALRLAKAMWWMLARIAGWDGVSNGISEVESHYLSLRKILTSEKIEIQFDDVISNWDAKLYDFRGILKSSMYVESDILTFDISSLSSGVYFVVLFNGKNRLVEKVIKP